MWRPKNWYNPFSIKVDPLHMGDQEPNFTNFEAGADAMLEAIWKLAEESPTKTFTFDKNHFHVYREE